MTTTTKAPKVTLNSIVFAAAPVLRVLAEGESHTKTELKAFEADVQTFIANQAIDLAKYLVNKTDNTDLIARLFTATVDAIPGVLTEAVKEREAEEARKQEEKAANEAAKEAERVQAEKAIEEKKNVVLQALLATGLDLATAQTMVNNGIKLAGSNAPKSSYDRVACEIDGGEYDVPVRGNMSQALKDLAAKYGFSDDRDGFISKFRKEPATTEGDNAEA